MNLRHISAAVALAVLLPIAAGALSVDELTAQIQNLLSQVAQLQRQLKSMQTTPPVACTMEAKICPDGSSVGRSGPNCEFATCPGNVIPPRGDPPEVFGLPPLRICPKIIRTLNQGISGSDVKDLQAYLGVSQTGYFGPLTARAVAKFQSSEGLSQVGIVGPQTRAAFARRCGGDGGGSSQNFSASPTYGTVPLTVTFTSRTPPGGNFIDFGDGTSGEILNWNITTMGCPIGVQCNSGTGSISHMYTSAGTYTATLIKTDAGMERPDIIVGTVTITVGGSTSGGFTPPCCKNAGLLSTSATWGPAPLPVTFTVQRPADWPEGGAYSGTSYQIKLDYGDGSSDFVIPGNCHACGGAHVYRSNGTYTAQLTKYNNYPNGPGELVGGATIRVSDVEQTISSTLTTPPNGTP